MVLLVTSLQTLFCTGECLYKTENKENKTKHVIQFNESKPFHQQQCIEILHQ